MATFRIYAKQLKREQTIKVSDGREFKIRSLTANKPLDREIEVKLQDADGATFTRIFNFDELVEVVS